MPREIARPPDPLGSQRQRYVDALEPRLAALDEALAALAAHPEHTSLRAQLEQRLDAMADAANALGFEQMSAAFASAQSALACATDPVTTQRATTEARSTLELIPSLFGQATDEAPAPIANSPAVVPPGPPATSGDVPGVTAPASSDRPLAQAANSAASVAVCVGVTEPPTPAKSLSAGTLVVLGILPLRAVCRSWSERFPDLSFHFTVDVEDAAALAADSQRPAIVIDGRRPDAGHAFHRLSDVGPCLIVEASERQHLAFEAQGAHAALRPGVDAGPLFEELFADAPKAQAPVEQGADTQPERDPSATRGGPRRTPKADVVVIPGRTILLADADPATAWFLTGLLRSAQATVLEARDGLEAWQLAQEREPDLIISDVALPELDGFGLCRNVKRDIALSDVPVLLVSWKEDALHRVRELGAGADGYFVKEADSATVLRRCAEALQLRVNIEKRLREEKTVHGRLQGMTPRSVLRLASEVVGDARVTFTDAAYTYVAYVGDGRLLSVERSAPNGTLLTGEAVLPSLLGMRASRFIVEPHAAVVQSTFFGSMSATFAPTFARLRRAARVLAGDALHRVARLDLDEAVVEPYVSSSPAIVQRLVEKLADGVPPFSLARSVTAGLLESVLGDLALRGAVRAALDVSGQDLLHAPDVFTQPFDIDVRTPTSGFDLLAAPGAPRINAHSTPDAVRRAADFASAHITKPETLVAKVGAPAAGLELPTGDDAAHVSDTAGEQAPQPELPEAPAGASARHEADSASGEHTPRSKTLIPRPEPSDETVDWAPTPKELLGLAAPLLNDVELELPQDATPSPSLADAEARGMSAPASVSPPPAALEAAAAASSIEAAPGPAEEITTEEPSDGRAASIAEKAAHASPELDLADALFGVPVLDLSSRTQSEQQDVPAAEQAEPEAQPEPSSELVVSTRLAGSRQTYDDDFVDDADPLFSSLHLVESEPSARAKTIRTNALADSDSTCPPRARTKATLDERVGSWSANARRVSKLAFAWATRTKRAPEPTENGAEQREHAPSVELSAPAPSPTSATSETSAKPDTDSQQKSPVPETPAKGGSGTALRARGKARAARLLAAGKKGLPAFAALGAAALAFSGVGAIVDRIESTRIQQDGTAMLDATQAAPPPVAAAAEADPEADLADLAGDSVAPPGSQPAKARMQMTTAELPLPEGIQIAAGKGLLEVNSGETHKIYVNGVFVGRGPVRRVPLTAGKHEVELRNDGEVDKHEITIVADKRIRLEPAAQAAVSR